MDLYLIRHAEAVPHGELHDAARPLTDLGREQARRLGELFARHHIQFDAIVTSPLVRARETLDGLLPALPEPAPQSLIYDEIGAAMRPRRVAKFLAKTGGTTLGIVGHEPTISVFLAWLIGSKKARVPMAKAGVAKLVCDSLKKGGAELEWLITPAMLG